MCTAVDLPTVVSDQVWPSTTEQCFYRIRCLWHLTLKLIRSLYLSRLMFRIVPVCPYWYTHMQAIYTTCHICVPSLIVFSLINRTGARRPCSLAGCSCSFAVWLHIVPGLWLVMSDTLSVSPSFFLFFSPTHTQRQIHQTVLQPAVSAPAVRPVPSPWSAKTQETSQHLSFGIL